METNFCLGQQIADVKILLYKELPQARPASGTLIQWNGQCLNFPPGKSRSLLPDIPGRSLIKATDMVSECTLQMLV